MPLQPIRFKTAEDLNKFLSYLQGIKLITIKEKKITVTRELGKQFIKANDGNIYLLHEVQQYLNEASEEEIKASGLSFFKGKTQANAFTIVFNENKNQPLLQQELVTLSQIKADASLVEQLTLVPEIASFISLLNPKIYSNEPLPSLIGRERVEEGRESFSGQTLSREIISHNSLIKTVNSLSTTLQRGESLLQPIKLLKVPLAFQSTDFLSNLQKDVYKLTLMQQIKLKFHLLKELKLVKNPEEKKQIEQWIKTIDEENVAIRELLANILDQLKSHTKLTNEAQLKYAEMLKADPDGVKIKTEIAAKTKEAEELLASIKQLEDIFEILKPLTSYGTIAILYTLFLTAVLLTPALIILLTVTVPLLGLVLLTLESVAVILSVHPVVGAIFALGELIENKFDSILEEKNQQHRGALSEVVALKFDDLFRANFSRSDAEFIENGSNHQPFIKALNNDLSEVDAFERAERSKMDQNTMLKVSFVGSHNLFPLQRSKSMSDLHNAVVDDLELPTKAYEI